MQHPEPAAAQRHAQHDTSLIAGLAADDLAPVDRARAEVQLRDCRECGSLRDDIVAIAAATKALPAAPAPRDYRLTSEQAARLRRRWRDVVLAPFRPGRPGTRRLAATFTTLGIAGIFAVAALPALLGGSAARLAPTSAGSGAGQVAASTAPEGLFGPVAQPTPAGGQPGPKDAAEGTAAPGQAISGDDTGAGGESDVTTRESGPVAPNWLLIGSVALLAAGLALFGLRYAGRRLR